MRKFEAYLLIVIFFSIFIVSGCGPSIESGFIAYDHNLLVNYGEFELVTKITGTIGFLSNEVSLTGGGPMYGGAGTCTVSISGTADDCVIDGSGTNSVQMDGFEYLNQIRFNFNEQWYQACSFTFTCPDGTQTIQLPSQTINHKLTFPVEDGYRIERSASGMGMSGTYSWTLHID